MSMRVVNASYLTVWDGGTLVTADCVYDPDTNTVSDIGDLDTDGLEILDKVFVKYRGEIIQDFVRSEPAAKRRASAA